MRMLSLPALVIICASPIAAAIAGCGGDDPSQSPTGGGTGGDGGAGGAGGGGGAPAACEPAKVACSDEIILGMNLQTDIAPGKIQNTAEATGGFLSKIDATAGGFGAQDPDSYVHARFTDMGLEKVDISDQASLDSMDWDVAFRRFVIRVNSGSSGPSCVTAARVPGTVAFDDYTAAADSLMYKPDVYFTESCELIPDGSGLGSPATVLSSFWNYPGCVQMTDHVYVVALRDGRKVKLAVQSYYSDAAQAQCDACTMNCSGLPLSGSANIQLRWAFFP